MASALDHLATYRIVHNDIKPKNIAYSRDRGAVLFDFGAATSPKFKQANGGTSWYLPPEFIETSARGAPGDIWAWGITMLYVTGKIQHPDRPSNNWSIIDSRDREKHAYQKALDWLPFISDQRAKLDQKDNVESLIYRMLQPEPTNRISAAAIITELRSDTSKLVTFK
ncbi:kinase-like domain-containing protein [Trichoderma sp. SZMC 28014]